MNNTCLFFVLFIGTLSGCARELPDSAGEHYVMRVNNLRMLVIGIRQYKDDNEKVPFSGAVTNYETLCENLDGYYDPNNRYTRVDKSTIIVFDLRDEINSKGDYVLVSIDENDNKDNNCFFINRYEEILNLIEYDADTTLFIGPDTGVFSKSEVLRKEVEF
ncbi:hypothetical protein [uncultured Rubinisphaera sp.]|uniref:hypothetical protein n=1 Tax=uncultured Rubinisphaera sp. TaxID=1678686 RepID=UPI0030DD41CD|tara:strand:- start:444 stop:926 length:483 start_codon:yes stop_codon:yes gene_type:complete